MLGAIIGDIVGSTRERRNVKTEDFEMLPPGSCYTDDSVMTLAVAEWLMKDPTHSKESLITCMQSLGRKYPFAGYGYHFHRWLMVDQPQPYNSYGNGSAMRVSPVALYAHTLEEALELAKISAEVSHNHPEGIKGAQAIAACIFQYKIGKNKKEIQSYVEQTFHYDLNLHLEELRKTYTFDVSCQGSVPVAIMAFLQRDTAEEALRLAISMGGDSDTIGCMTSAIHTANLSNEKEESQKSIQALWIQCLNLLDPCLREIIQRFDCFLHQSLS